MPRGLLEVSCLGAPSEAAGRPEPPALRCLAPALEAHIVDSTEDALTALTMADTGRGVDSDVHRLLRLDDSRGRDRCEETFAVNVVEEVGLTDEHATFVAVKEL
jgi:hypothetical protein